MSAVTLGRGADAPQKADGPRVMLVAPLALSPGGPAKTVRLRGVKLSNASAVKFPDVKAPVTATVKNKGAAEVPQNLDGKDVGDTQVELEITLPPETPPGPLNVVVVTPEGESPPHAVTLAAADTLVEEKEPNGGFREAQEVAADGGKQVVGAVQQAQDVDVYRLDGKAGRKVAAEVTAARAGALLDPALTLYDAAGHMLASADDDPRPGHPDGPSRDPVLRFTFPADGVYYLSLQDAHDRGGQGSHPYLLAVREGE